MRIHEEESGPDRFWYGVLLTEGAETKSKQSSAVHHKGAYCGSETMLPMEEIVY